MAKRRNFREEIEEEFAEFREYYDSEAEDQKLMLSYIESCQIAPLSNMLTRGVDPNFCNRYGESPLHIAIEKRSEGWLEVLQMLLYFGAPLERRDRFGITVLHKACQLSSEAVSLLLDAGCPVNSQDNAGRTSLMLACGSDSPEALVIVQSLLDRDALVNLSDEDGKTALHYICANHKGLVAVRTEIVYKLLYAGATINAQCHRGLTPLYMELVTIFLTRKPQESTDEEFNVFRTLLKSGASTSGFQEILKLLRGLVQKWGAMYLRLFCILEPLTSVSQVRQLIAWMKPSPLDVGRNVDDPEIVAGVVHALKRSSRTVRSLKCTSRTAVRTILLARQESGNLFLCVDKLSLPRYLEEYLIDVNSV